ncbi:putative ribosomal protein 50S-L18Ae/60S-L20/60S-L18A [Medicago truncatula]|uniref:Putative ribosomal protein 50S-L18Ae/60S-L20/60S-L18A n=1 Tax=Medicago truncatula TaxID=3880 RepID=A0A396J2Q7_MEDTR|nr:putative ribosomal protein 50S-L18Ae/60S-L20/60S-L18A [Medicago truncatula]
MYKEFRDTTLNGAVDLMYNETASRHRVCFPCIQIIKTATIPAKLCKRESTKQFHDSKDQVPIGFQENHTTTQEAEDNIQGQEAELVYVMWSSDESMLGFSKHSSCLSITRFCHADL